MVCYGISGVVNSQTLYSRDGVCDAAGYSLNYPSKRWKLFVGSFLNC